MHSVCAERGGEARSACLLAMWLFAVMLTSGCRGVAPRDGSARSGEGSPAVEGRRDASPHIVVKTPRIHPPRKVIDVQPAYPEDAKRKRIQGVVVLELTIERTGEVSSARVLRGIPALDQAAVEAAMKWRYTQPLLGTTPVRIVMMASVTFRLEPSTE